MHKLKIRVTDKHIKNGVKDDSSQCPIALAAIDATFEKFGPKFGIRKSQVQACVDGGDDYVVVPDPFTGEERRLDLRLDNGTLDRVGDFIANYDDGNKVKPFSFTAEI